MSNIEWTEATWNPVVGCTPVSPGCLNCYAARMAHRLAGMGQEQYVGLTVKRGENTLKAGGGPGRRVFNGTVRCLPDRLDIPLRWKRPRMIFVNSMSDLFHDDVPVDFQVGVFAVMAACPQHTFQVLTKRPDRMSLVLCKPEFWLAVGAKTYAICEERSIGLTPAQSTKIASGEYLPLPNVWLGASVEDQPRGNDRVPELLKCPAALHFLSVEPLLGPVDLSVMVAKRLVGLPQPKWVIVGGESGPRSRSCNIEWIRGVVSQCKAAGVPCFVKQIGSRPYDMALADAVPGSRRPITAAAMDIPEAAEQAAKVLGEVFDAIRLRPKDKKGGNPSEWPDDLRVRQIPGVTA